METKIKNKLEELIFLKATYRKMWNGNPQHPTYKKLMRLWAQIDILEELLEDEM